MKIRRLGVHVGVTVAGQVIDRQLAVVVQQAARCVSCGRLPLAMPCSTARDGHTIGHLHCRRYLNDGSGA